MTDLNVLTQPAAPAAVTAETAFQMGVISNSPSGALENLHEPEDAILGGDESTNVTDGTG